MYAGKVLATVSLLICLGAAHSQPATTQSTASLTLPPAIRAALQRSAGALAPGITISWTVRRDPPLTAREYAGVAGSQNFDHHKTFTEENRVILTWRVADGHYLESVKTIFHPSESDRRIVRFNMQYSYDGQMFFTHTANPDEVHSLQRIQLNEEDHDNMLDLGYLNAMDLHPPLTNAELTRHQNFSAGLYSPLFDQFSKDVDLESGNWITPGLLSLLNTHLARLTAIDTITLDPGHPLTRLRLEPAPVTTTTAPTTSMSDVRVFYLDPKYHYALRRFERESVEDGELLFRIDCTDFRPTQNGDLFLPNSVVTTQFDEGEPIETLTYRLGEILFGEPPDDLFTLNDTTPRTWIIDGFGSHQQVHVVQKDGSLRLRRKSASRPAGAAQ